MDLSGGARVWEVLGFLASLFMNLWLGNSWMGTSVFVCYLLFLLNTDSQRGFSPSIDLDKQLQDGILKKEELILLLNMRIYQVPGLIKDNNSYPLVPLPLWWNRQWGFKLWSDFWAHSWRFVTIVSNKGMINAYRAGTGVDKLVIFVGWDPTPPSLPRRFAQVLQRPLLVTLWLFDADADLEFYEQEVWSHKRDFNEFNFNPPLLSPFHLQPAAHMTQTPVNTQYLRRGAWSSLNREGFFFFFVEATSAQPSGCMWAVHVRCQLHLRRVQRRTAFFRGMTCLSGWALLLVTADARRRGQEALPAAVRVLFQPAGCRFLDKRAEIRPVKSVCVVFTPPFISQGAATCASRPWNWTSETRPKQRWVPWKMLTTLPVEATSWWVPVLRCKGQLEW